MFDPADSEESFEETAASDPLLGRVIAGKMKIEALLGSGAMGRVYRAHHQGLDKVVAIKVLHTVQGEDREIAARFKAEARAASRLEHRNSLQILDFGEDGADKLLYIAMEYLDGQDLESLLQQQPLLTGPHTVHIMAQVLAALSAAHEHGVVHRDMKPGNIMLVPRTQDDGVVRELVKVCDFGLAKILDPGSEESRGPMTRDGAVFGTPAYMSPEQARGEVLDPRTDIYSCGVILYRLLTGLCPFKADTLVGVLMKQIAEPPVPPSIHAPVDSALETVVLKAMAKERGDRFQTAREMRAALLAYLTHADPSFIPLSNPAVPVYAAPKPSFSATKPQVLSVSSSARSAPSSERTESSINVPKPRAPFLALDSREGQKLLVAAAFPGVFALVLAGVLVVFMLRSKPAADRPHEVPPTPPAANIVVSPPRDDPSSDTPGLVPTIPPIPNASSVEAERPPNGRERGRTEIREGREVRAARERVARHGSDKKVEAGSSDKREEPLQPPVPKAPEEAAPVSPAASIDHVPAKGIDRRSGSAMDIPVVPQVEAPALPVMPSAMDPPAIPPPPAIGISPSAKMTPKKAVRGVKTTLTPFKVSGGITRTKSEDAFRKAEAGIRTCVEREVLRTGQSEAGIIKVEARVSLSGMVDRVMSKGPLEVQSCLAEAFRAVRFPKPDTGEGSLRFEVQYQPVIELER